MKIVLGGVLAAVVSLCAVQSAAAQGKFVAELNAASVEGDLGAEVGLGYRFAFSRFRLTPAAGVFVYHDENSPYYRDANGGNARCRDSRNGQYASDADCMDLKGYARLELSYAIPGLAEIGGGGRYSGDTIRPYGTVAVGITPALSVKGNAGDDYYALGFKLAF